MKAYLVTTGIIFALIGVAHIVRAFAEGPRLAKDPLYFAKPDRALFQDIRRYFPITCQAEVAWAVTQGVNAATQFIDEQH